MIKTRFSPSPTGLVHLGNARSALFSAFYAMKMKGVFLLRIEDTDRARSEQKYVDLLQDDLHWLGIEWQEGPYFQSDRSDLYAQYYSILENRGEAYPCFCTDEELAFNRKLQLSRGQAPRYPGTCRQLTDAEKNNHLKAGRKPALRFIVPQNTTIEFTDLVKGLQSFKSEDIGDFIIRRADGSSSFLFCNAIDDSLMEVSHVIRGEDHLTNTPRQLMLLKTLDMVAPQYGHLSLILSEEGAKLSKRQGSFSVTDLRREGYLSAAVLNYLARLSHRYDDQHLYSFQKLAAHFELEKLSRAPARFDTHQLLHWQKIAVQALNSTDFWQWLPSTLSIPIEHKSLFEEVIKQNSLFPNDALKWASIFFKDELSFDPEQVSILKAAGPIFFEAAVELTHSHKTDIKIILDQLKTQLSLSGKQLFMPLRIALTGELHGPELHYIARLLGTNKMQKRLEYAREIATV